MARKKITRPALEATPRHLWLASLGLAAMAGRQTVSTVNQTVDRVSQARRMAVTAMAQTQTRIVETVDGLRTGIVTGVSHINGAVENTVAPLIAKFRPAKAQRATRRGRKPAAKPVRRAAAKKTVKRARRA